MEIQVLHWQEPFIGLFISPLMPITVVYINDGQYMPAGFFPYA